MERGLEKIKRMAAVRRVGTVRTASMTQERRQIETVSGEMENDLVLSWLTPGFREEEKLVCVSCINVPILFSGFKKRLWHQA